MAHPAAKSMIELSRAQDEEVGDGTTSVIILSECFIYLVYCERDANGIPTLTLPCCSAGFR